MMRNDNRLHVTQMSSDEKQAVISDIKNRRFAIKKHAKDRMLEKGISLPELHTAILDAVVNTGIIEVHQNVPYDTRVLLRGKTGNKDVCIVLSVTQNEIVTVYPNAQNDNHRTIDWRNYRPSFESYFDIQPRT